MGLLAELHALRINLYLHQQHVDTTTPAGRAVLAEFERAMIQGRVRSCEQQKDMAWTVAATPLAGPSWEVNMSSVAVSKSARGRDAGGLRQVLAGLAIQLAAVARAVGGFCVTGRSERVHAAMSDCELKDLGLERDQLRPTPVRAAAARLGSIRRASPFM